MDDRSDNIEELKVICLHGLGQSVSSYDNLRKHLSQFDVDVLQLPKEANFIDLRNKVFQQLQKIQEPYALFGLSLGGVLSLSLVNALPSCKRLMVSGSQYRLSHNRLFRLQIAIMSLLPKSFYAKRGLDKVQLVTLQKSMVNLDLQEVVRAIKQPSLVICGSKDKPNLKAAYALRDLIPNAQLSIVEGGGHELNIQKPEELAQLIRDFVKS